MTMQAPKIFYDNRFADATPVASDTAPASGSTTYDVNNLTDWRPYIWWQPIDLPATVTVDCGSAQGRNF